MNRKTGIWIDHKKAFLVVLEGQKTTVKRIESGAESHFRPSGGWKTNGTDIAASIFNEHKAENRRKHQYHVYYQKVLKEVAKSEEIIILGPGEAKKELSKEMKKHKHFPARLTDIKTFDDLTENQIIAQVKAYFYLPDKRHLPEK